MLALTAAFVLLGIRTSAQQSKVLHQILIASGGAFSDPDDFVTVSSFFPLTSEQTTFATIYTQAVQDVLIDSTFLFVAATDSLVMFDLNTYEHIDAIALPGLSQLYAAGDFLFVSIQYPETSGFLKVLKRYSLNLLEEIQAISDEASGMDAHDDRLYIAVPGGWMSTKGKLAVVEMNSLSLIEEIDLGDQSVGIHNLFVHGDMIVAVCRTPWGSNTGTLTVYDINEKSIEHIIYNHVFGKGIAIDEDTLYLIVDDGVGAIDLSDFSMINNSLIADPGSESFIYFADVVYNDLNNDFYATTTDYFSFGQGHIFNQSGNETGLFSAGISPEAIGLDYRYLTEVKPEHSEGKFQISPNPAINHINIVSDAVLAECTFQVFTIHGKLVLEQIKMNSTVDISSIPAGYYVLVFRTKDFDHVLPFVKVTQ